MALIKEADSGKGSNSPQKGDLWGVKCSGFEAGVSQKHGVYTMQYDDSTLASRIKSFRTLILGREPTAAEVAASIKLQAQRLLEWLYDPVDSSLGWMANKRVLELGFSAEVINWGDLNVTEVEPQEDGSFIVHVEEAAPDCKRLQTWLADWLRAWGWDCHVETEW